MASRMVTLFLKAQITSLCTHRTLEVSLGLLGRSTCTQPRAPPPTLVARGWSLPSAPGSRCVCPPACPAPPLALEGLPRSPLCEAAGKHRGASGFAALGAPRELVRVGSGPLLP